MIGDRLIRVAHHAFVILLVVGSAIALSAQTVVDPRYVEFTPSADHNTLASDGTPLVQRYSLSVFPVGSSTATATTDLGKPTPSGGIIRVDLLQFLQTIPTGLVFEARVTAVGPGGSTASSVSNGFSFQAACAPTLNSTSQSVGSGATTGSVGVTAGSGCTWSAVSNAGWITLSGATSGNGNGTVPYNVSANGSTSPRSGTLTVAGQTFTVNQAALSCSYSVSPTSQSVAAGGGTGSTSVTAPAGCAWTGVSNNTSWLSVTSGASGNGNGTVAFSASSNPNTSARTGTITIGGQTFSVTQAATSCTFALLPASQSVAATGGTGSTTVTTLAGCAWTGVSNNTSWLTVTSGGSGNGTGTVAFSAAANPNGTQRNGSLTIAGQTFSVTQAAAPCTYSINPASQSVLAGGGTGSTAVTAPTGCAWTGVSNNTSWLTVTSGGSGSGGGSVGFSAAANASTTQRSGTLTIGGQTLTVTQSGAACWYSINPTSQSVVAAGGTGSTTVTTLAGCAWTGASNNTSWLTVTSGASGNGTGTVAFSAGANLNGTARSGSLTIAGQTFSVTQAAAPCTYSINPASQSLASAGGPGSTVVTAPTGCAWTGVSNNTSWLTVTSGANGNGGGTVGFSATANPNGIQRSGSLTIGGQTLSVTQAAAPCTYSINPASQAVNASLASGSTSVTAPAGCAWTAVSNDTGWLTVTSGATGSGGGSVGFSASGNASTSQRVGTLTVAGQTLTVTQAGVGCTFTLSSSALSVAATGGSGSTNVTAPAGCPWSGSSNVGWITVTGGASGAGNGSTAFSVAANPNATTRSGTLTIATQTFTVSQAAAACTYSLSPTSQQVAASGGGGSTTLTTATGCAWTASSTALGWLSVSGTASGSGPATVSFTAAANTSTQARAAALTIGGQSFTVNQAGVSCTVSILAGEHDDRLRQRIGLDQCDGGRWLRVDGGEQRELADSFGWRRRDRERPGHVQRDRQHGDAVTHGRDHDRRRDVHSDAERIRVCILDLADGADRGGSRGHRVGGGHDHDRLQLDRGEQRHLDHRHGWCHGFGRRFGQLHDCPEHQRDPTHREPDDRRPPVHRDAVGEYVHLYLDAYQPDPHWVRRVGYDYGRHLERVCMAGDDDAGVDQRQRQRHRLGLGELHRAAQHDRELAHRIDQHRHADVLGRPDHGRRDRAGVAGGASDYVDWGRGLIRFRGFTGFKGSWVL